MTILVRRGKGTALDLHNAGTFFDHGTFFHNDYAIADAVFGGFGIGQMVAAFDDDIVANPTIFI